MGFPGGSEVKASACNAGELGSIPGSGRSPGEGNGNPLQYSCLENPMDRGVWWATVHGVAQSQMRLSDLTFINNSKMLDWQRHQSLSCAIFHFAQEKQIKREGKWLGSSNFCLTLALMMDSARRGFYPDGKNREAPEGEYILFLRENRVEIYCQGTEDTWGCRLTQDLIWTEVKGVRAKTKESKQLVVLIPNTINVPSSQTLPPWTLPPSFCCFSGPQQVA